MLILDWNCNRSWRYELSLDQVCSKWISLSCLPFLNNNDMHFFPLTHWLFLPLMSERWWHVRGDGDRVPNRASYEVVSPVLISCPHRGLASFVFSSSQRYVYSSGEPRREWPFITFPSGFYHYMWTHTLTHISLSEKWQPMGKSWKGKNSVFHESFFFSGSFGGYFCIYTMSDQAVSLKTLFSQHIKSWGFRPSSLCYHLQKSIRSDALSGVLTYSPAPAACLVKTWALTKVSMDQLLCREHGAHACCKECWKGASCCARFRYLQNMKSVTHPHLQSSKSTQQLPFAPTLCLLQLFYFFFDFFSFLIFKSFPCLQPSLFFLCWFFTAFMVFSASQSHTRAETLLLKGENAHTHTDTH